MKYRVITKITVAQYYIYRSKMIKFLREFLSLRQLNHDEEKSGSKETTKQRREELMRMERKLA